MPIIACPTKNDCRGPGQSGSPFDPSNPFANLSAEAPDEDSFIGIDYDRRTDPPLGSSWTTAGCQSTCLSTISQQDADLCAARQAVLCNQGEWRWPSFPRGTCPEGTVFNPATGFCELPVFFNTPQTCFSFCPDGQPFAFSQTFPAFAEFSQALVNAQALSFACKEAAARRVCLSNLSPSEACMDSPYFAEIGVSANAPATMTITSGSLPAGITADQANPTSPLVLSGIPTSDGTYSFVVRAQTAELDLMEKTYSIRVVTILNSALTEANKNEPYSFSLTIGGTPSGNITWTLISGTLPDGLTLDSASGVISGTPTVGGDFAFRIGFSDGGVSLCAKDLTLTVNDFQWNLVWGAPVINNTGGGATASGVYGATGWQAEANQGGAAGSAPDIGCSAAQTYTSPVPINVNLQMNQLVLGTAPSVGNNFIGIAVDGNPLISMTTGPNGTTDYPFVMPAAVNGGITVDVFTVIEGAPGDGSINWTGLLTVLP